MRTALLVAPMLMLAVTGCGSESLPTDAASAAASKPTVTTLAAPAGAMTRDPLPSKDHWIFSEESAASGLDFVHVNGMSGEYYFSEHVGPGIALFDYDNDGDLDLYAVQGGRLGEPSPNNPASNDVFRDRLFRNELTNHADGSRELRWTDVTADSGLDARGYGMGVATGDIDNDGWVDLYLTNFGRNQLWRNRGDGTFEDLSRESGTDDPDWSVPAVFCDFDRDGWLDLFVANYVDFTLATHKLCRQPSGAPEYCGPLSYEPVADRLFRNRGGEGAPGRFDDISDSAGLRSARGGALGATVGDFDGDGWLDLYVANDGVPNLMWINQGTSADPLAFRERAFVAGSAVNALGQAEASMGVSAADFDRDGDEDLFMTHLNRETHTLYRNDGSGHFDDASKQSGIDMATWDATGFGTAWLDLDNDGWLDLLTVNGAVKTIPEQVAAGDLHPLRQPNQLFRNLGPDAGGRIRLQEITERAGPGFDAVEVSRGAAIGDLDNDGDTDVVVANNAGPLRLLINRVGQDQSWIGLRLVDTDGRRDMLGAWVGVLLEDGDELWRRVATAGSYASASDPRLLFGLGGSLSEQPINRVTVHWPDGSVEIWDGDSFTPERYTTLRQGGNRE